MTDKLSCDWGARGSASAGAPIGQSHDSRPNAPHHAVSHPSRQSGASRPVSGCTCHQLHKHTNKLRIFIYILCTYQSPIGCATSEMQNANYSKTGKITAESDIGFNFSWIKWWKSKLVKAMTQKSQWKTNILLHGKQLDLSEQEMTGFNINDGSFLLYLYLLHNLELAHLCF